MLIIDKISRKPIYEQLMEGIGREIAIGLIKENEQLPSIRELSEQLGINPNTVQKALMELDRLGVVISVPGRGVFVREGAGDAIRRYMRKYLTAMEENAVALAKAGIPMEEVVEMIRRAYEYEAADKTEGGERS